MRPFSVIIKTNTLTDHTPLEPAMNIVVSLLIILTIIHLDQVDSLPGWTSRTSNIFSTCRLYAVIWNTVFGWFWMQVIFTGTTSSDTLDQHISPFASWTSNISAHNLFKYFTVGLSVYISLSVFHAFGVVSILCALI